jgi:bacillithiol synthase
VPASFLDAYKSGQLASFYNLAPDDLASSLTLPRSTNRPELVQSLRRYAEMLKAPKAVFKSLEKLEHPDSRAVVTGQQAGLLLGPNYTLSKAITAINLAKELSSEEKPVVPIFWVASQDHDVAEVNHAYLLDMAEKLKRLELPLPENTPVGRIALDASWLEQLKTELQTLNVPEHNRQDVLALLERTASCAKTFADWFAAILYELLGEQGLIVLNPMEADVAMLFWPILEAELKAPERSSQAINAAGQRLREISYDPQLGRAEGATNLFLEENGLRHLLRVEGKHFFTEANRYTVSDLQKCLDEDPASITPAAGLRPITQDFILPTAVTVLGPGELRYFAQLKGVYEAHGVAMPLTWARATATVLEPPVFRIMEKFNLSFADIQNLAKRKEDILLRLNGHAASFEETLGTLETSLEKLLTDVNAVDPTLQGAVKRGEVYFKKTLSTLKTKSAKAVATQDDIYTQQFARLEQHLLPNGEPQERLISPFSFFLKFGIKPVINAFLTLPTKESHEIRL